MRRARKIPFVLQWHITERCNLRCEHCYQEGYSADDEVPFDDLLVVLEQFKELLKRRRREIKPEALHGHINVSGGEPFTRSDFLDLLEVFSANRESFTFGLLTNGTFIDEATARQLKAVNPAFVQVSIEGAPTTNDGIRGAGVFERASHALRHLVEAGVKAIISFTAHRDNFREFPEVAGVGRRLGVTQVWADRLIPWGSGSTLGDQLLSPEETREFFKLMYTAHNQAAGTFCRTEIHMGRALQFLVGGGIPYSCAAGDRLVTVQPNGDLYPCRRMPIHTGNLFNTSLTDLYYENELFRRLRDHKVSEGCEECAFASRCRGGLKCLAYAVTGDAFRADPGCWIASL